jgi:tetratricopeptide (TPR) repeat protein
VKNRLNNIILIFTFFVYIQAIGQEITPVSPQPDSALYDPKAEIFYNQSIDMYIEGRADSAMKALNNAILLKPDFVDALYNRGVIEYKSKFYQEALADLNKTGSSQ